MNKCYSAKRLIVGRIHFIDPFGRSVPLGEGKDVRYIFEIPTGPKKLSNKYTEILTGETYKLKEDLNINFKMWTGICFIIERESILKYLKVQEKLKRKVSRERLLEVYNKLNFKKKKTKSLILFVFFCLNSHIFLKTKYNL